MKGERMPLFHKIVYTFYFIQCLRRESTCFGPFMVQYKCKRKRTLVSPVSFFETAQVGQEVNKPHTHICATENVEEERENIKVDILTKFMSR